MAKDETYQDIEYEPLSNASSSTTPRGRRWRWQWSFTSFAVGCAATVLITSVVLMTVAIVQRNSVHEHHSMTEEEVLSQDWNYCGRTSQEAVERGCLMDPALYSWMPPQCYFHDLTISLPPIFENRKYYKNENLTEEIPIEDLYAAEHHFIYTME
jgi:hypothetical protein